MSERFNEQVVAEVKDRTDIVKVIGQHVQLKRAGASLKGLCPFHGEKTPSFIVNPARQSYYCFGCHEKGDVLDFLQKINGRSFFEVLEELAAAAGIPLPQAPRSPAEVRREGEREQAGKAMKLAAEFFRAQLRGPEGAAARRYLAGRRLSDEIIDGFQLGYAPAGWDALTRHLERHRVPAGLATRLGLVVRRQRDTEPPPGELVSPAGYYDFFRDRAMFPILASGGVAGFSGRLLDPEAKERKYVNSPESLLYHKSEILFGLPLARTAMRKHDRAVLVEGNVDVLAMHQVGLTETVAPLGTAFTDRQLQILRRFVSTVVLMYDGDNAGRAAALKAAELLVAEDVTCRVALLPDGQDPADLCVAAPERVAPLVEGATSAVAFLIATAAAQAGPTIEERAKVAEGLARVLGRLKNPVVRDEYTRQAAAALALRPDQVARLVGGGPVVPVAAPAGPARGAPAAERPGEAAEIGLTLLALITAHPRLAPLAAREGLLALLPDPDTGVLLREAIRQQAETGRVEVSTLLDHAPEALRDRVAARLLDDDPGGDEANASRALFELIGRLRLQELERELAALTPAIQEAGSRGADEAKRDLVLRRLSLARQKDELVTAMSRGQRPPG